MKTKHLFTIACIAFIFSGCSDSVRLENPILIDKAELTKDRDTADGVYRVYLKAFRHPDGRKDEAFFYTNKYYKVGEALVPFSQVQPIIDKSKTNLMDTLAIKNKYILRLQHEKDSLISQLKEKTLLIRFLTGK